MKSGAGKEDVHVPTLWYFDDFDFLRDQEEAHRRVFLLLMRWMNLEVPSKRTKKNSSCDEKNEFLTKACMHLDSLKEKDEANEDESEVYAKSWACSYIKIDEQQKIYAKKAIEEILILGQLKQLTINAVNTNTPQPSRFSSPRMRFLPSPATSSSNPSPTPVKIIKLPAYFQVPPEQAEEDCFSEQELYEENHYY